MDDWAVHPATGSHLPSEDTARPPRSHSLRRLSRIPSPKPSSPVWDLFRGSLKKYFILYANISCATVHTPDESNLYHTLQVNQKRSLQGLRLFRDAANISLHIVVDLPSIPGLDALRYVSCRGGQKQELSCPVVS